MIIIMFVMLAFYYVVHREMKRKPGTARPRFQTWIVSWVLTLTVFMYSWYYGNRPPAMDYYATGWIFLIQSLNSRYASLGNPNRIPSPENWK